MTTTEAPSTRTRPPAQPESTYEVLVRDAIEEARTLVLPAMRDAFEELDTDMRLVCAYHQGWVDPAGNPAQGSSGKLLRPTMTIAVAKAVGGAPAEAVPAGVAVELVHAFSLLHDDIMDNDEERRHRPTAWKVFGRPKAVLAGDALLSLSQSVLAVEPRARAERAIRRIARDTQRLIAGQRADLSFETRHDVTLPEYVDMAIGKTGALISSSCALSAELVGADENTVEALAWCGEQIGLAFQIVDDILGIWGDPRQMGKPVFSDLRNRRKTYPVLAALQEDGSAVNRLREIYFGSGPLPEDLAVEAARLIEEVGGRDRAHLEVKRLTSSAADVIDGLGISGEHRATLASIARAMTRRVK